MQVLTFNPTKETYVAPASGDGKNTGNYNVFFLNLPSPSRLVGFNYSFDIKQVDSDMIIQDTFYLVPWTIGFDNTLGLMSGSEPFSVGGGNGKGNCYKMFPVPFPFSRNSRNVQLVVYSGGYVPGTGVIFVGVE